MSNNTILVSLRCEFLLRGFDRDLRLSDNRNLVREQIKNMSTSAGVNKVIGKLNRVV